MKLNISITTVIGHYDEAQLPSDGRDPDYFNRFIIYARDTSPTSGGCDGEFNDYRLPVTTSSNFKYIFNNTIHDNNTKLDFESLNNLASRLTFYHLFQLS